jgi:type IV pilus assembly protein PilC
MTTYIYEAYNKDRALVRDEYEGVNREEVVEYLIKRNLTPVSVKELHARGDKKGIFSIEFFERLTPVDVMFLVRNMATTIKAGLSIVESLDILIADSEKKILKKALQEVQATIKNGQPLSQGFEAYKDAFPPIFLGMLRAGEVSGQLGETLTLLGKYLSKEYSLRSKVRSALTYPVILLVASFAVVTLLLMFVLPNLAKAFASSGVELPWITKLFMSLSNILTWSYTVDIVVLSGLIWFFLQFRTTRRGKKFFFWVLSNTPVASDLIKRVALVRFARTFGNLVASGLSAVESLELSAESIGNESYKLAINNAIVDIKSGVTISDALSKYPDLFPRLLMSLIIVGERTGSLHEILTTFAEFYEEEVDNKLKDLASVLEPALLLVMGVLVGAIAISIILPIYQLVGNFV